MKFNNSQAEIFIPDHENLIDAIERTTHLGIGAHQDDLEIMAFHGIGVCFEKSDKWFGGVTCTNGQKKPIAGKYANFSDKEIGLLRKKEQERAAIVGKYGFLAQLEYSSVSIMNPQDQSLEEDLIKILTIAKPSVVYTHNLADKHETHIRTVVAVINAIRELPNALQPDTLLGCEVWRGLDWLQDEHKIALDVSDKIELGNRLIIVYHSQLESGKRYDLATGGRRHANATYFNPYQTDDATQLIFAMDLSPLIKNHHLKIEDFVIDHIKRFQLDVEEKLKKFITKP